MRVLYKCMRYAENNKYYDSLMFTNILEHNNNVNVLGLIEVITALIVD